MQMPRIEIVEDNVTSQQKASILDALLTYNNAMARHTVYVEFAIVLRHPESGDVIGGLYGLTDHGWSFVKLLVVPEAYRGLGLGRRLMAEAEAIARRHESEGLWLETFDFQARPFYEKLGFQLFGELEAGEKAHGQFFLKKRF
ncbi:GNAT family N-acetyltransferase [Agrobacterium vitis]|uniref:GNAT family N-acetyltransferase n=1 Tax=Agrobacterium vitis TaxID=373 RepID=A0A368NVE2_AGRVI|nr:GNAT family N-acetyltransferase [Agrobacterium vitis]KAA3519381.1 GNAT family N-acetyltransferase [Agrobacterium vitis]KAA3532411.1 GNAT family N-acetyltransferase [Agrobacterium vitis]MCF1475489.1 GNAT family N-acetyltransferase [Agrobacterium vitis]MUZ95278.1 GNAT family N-acetyltransferase [Agrobacterium vitis]MVA30023.1 GNAT family N-acetyltransferase [Agrobacterium vitis]